MLMALLLIILIVLSLAFDFLNGFHDSANIVATIVSSRAMSARAALILATVAEFCGPFIVGIAVAQTIGGGIANPEALTITVVLAAMASAIIWNIGTWVLGIPSSSSHALIGGIIGAVLISAGPAKLQAAGIIKVMVVLFTSPLIGFIAGFFVTKSLFFATRNATPKINYVFKRAQIFSSAFLAISHGGNDAQKTMGVITMGLIMYGKWQGFASIPPWVMIACSVAMALGISFGGFRIMKTMGFKIFKVRPVHGFAVQLSSSLVILAAALVGGPVSTTHVVSSSVFGSGSADRVSKVHWSLVREILKAWVITLPACALLGAGIHFLIRNLK